MAIKLIANYSKRLGLPGYSSHQFSVSVETELVKTDDIPVESQRLYQLLQHNVDEQIQATGFVPPLDYGTEPAAAPNGQSSANTAWKCSNKQRDLIMSIVDEHQLDKNNIEALATERFGKGVKMLSKLEASGLIDELIETHGGGSNRGRERGKGSAYAGSSGRRAA